MQQGAGWASLCHEEHTSGGSLRPASRFCTYVEPMSVKAAAPCRPLKRPLGPLSLASCATSCTRSLTSPALSAPTGLHARYAAQYRAAYKARCSVRIAEYLCRRFTSEASEVWGSTGGTLMKGVILTQSTGVHLGPEPFS